MEAKQSSMGRRLERINAIRHAEYKAEAPPPEFEINLGRGSFRIRGGSDREIELLCSSLGLSGPDDFAIPPSVWAAAVRSRADLSPHVSSILEQPPEKENLVDVQELIVSTKKSLTGDENSGDSAVRQLHKEEVSIDEGSKEASILPLVRREEERYIDETKVVSTLPLPPGRFISTPPPSIRLPPIERADSTWDILKAFAPEENDKHEIPLNKMNQEEEVGVRVGVTVNDYAESISKEQVETVGSRGNLREERGEVIGIFPHGSLKRTISSWTRGHLLGSGSFGAVYEAISELV